MREVSSGLAVATLLSIALLGPSAGGPSLPSPAVEACGVWEVVPSPNASPERNLLRGVSASGPDDAWAVGEFDATPGEDILPRTLALHWDGAAWNAVATPNVGPNWNVLEDVAAIANADAWAVGWHQQEVPPVGEPQTLAVHWGGTAWDVVSSPVVTGGSEFLAIDAAAGAVWAVGDQAGPGNGSTGIRFLAARWTGGSWQEEPTPILGNARNHLYDVEVVAPDDVWAVGRFRDVGETSRTLALHWDGATWSAVPTPRPGIESILEKVESTATNDVWTTGQYHDGVASRPLTLHWDGGAWTAADNAGGGVGLAALGPADVWAVGMNFTHWDGGAWTVAQSAPDNGALSSAAAVGACDAWAAGLSFDAAGVMTTLTMRLVSPDPAPSPPRLVSAALAGPDVTLYWDLSADDGGGTNDVSGYEVWAGTAYDSLGDSYSLLASLPAGTTTYAHPGAGIGDEASYFYRVLVVDSGGHQATAATQAAKVSLFLSSGRNLVSLPLDVSDASLEAVLATVPWTHVTTYVGGDNPWRSRSAGKPWPTLAEIDRARAYWIETSVDEWWTIAGLVPTTTQIVLQPGWNLVGYPSVLVRSLEEVLAGADVRDVQGFAPAPPYHLGPLAPADTITAGDGLWVRASSAAVLTVTN